MTARGMRGAISARPTGWVWVAFGLFVLVVASIAAIHGRQRQVLGESIRALETIRRARIDLAKGFLFSSLGEEDRVFDPELGLALLDQATVALARALRETEGGDAGEVRTFEERLSAFRALVRSWKGERRVSPAREAELRIAYYDLERRADGMDSRVSARLAALAARLDRLFWFILVAGLVLLAGVFRYLVTAAHHRAAAQRELELSESRLRALLDHLPDWVWFKDLDSRYVTANLSLARYLGRSVAQIVGGSDRDLWASPLAEAFVATDRQVLSSGQPLGVEEQVGRGAEERWQETIKAPILSPAGHLLGTVGVARDVTDRKRAELERARVEAERAQAQRLESIGRLAGGVAHDFNNMLGVILGAAEVLLAQLARDDPMLEVAQDLREAALRSRGITKQLLAFSRQQPVAPRVLELDAAIAALRGTLARLLGEDIELRYRAGAGGAHVRLDPSQLDQVLVNLAANARDAMPDGGLLEIETEFVPAASGEIPEAKVGPETGGYVRLRFLDHGVGMDAETCTHIFEPFFTTKGDRGGSGLGLATVYGIVTQNRGQIRVSSILGQGTTFDLLWPVVDQGGLPSVPAARSGKGRTKGRCVLLVEDDPLVRSTIAKMIGQLGHRVIVEPSAAAALDLVQGGPEVEIDLLVTDVVMPGLSGPELQQAMARLRPGLSTLFVSGWAAGGAMPGDRLGASVLVLQKPFTLEELRDKLEQGLEGKS
ncbi:MAG TPA: PAS domain-containing protein [Anaeromyxobacter sp.]|nr:PAS domain-containing protein [Anaeromyxobacter sp.]